MITLTYRQVRDRTIIFDAIRRDWSSARGWGVSIVAASLVFGVALVSSAIAGFTP